MVKDVSQIVTHPGEAADRNADFAMGSWSLSLLENCHHRVVNQAVAGQAFEVAGSKRGAVKVADATPGLGNQQHAGGGIPGFELHLPETVEATGGDAGEIETGGARAATGLGLLLKMKKVIEIVGWGGGACRCEAGGEEGAIKTVDR